MPVSAIGEDQPLEVQKHVSPRQQSGKKGLEYERCLHGTCKTQHKVATTFFSQMYNRSKQLEDNACQSSNSHIGQVKHSANGWDGGTSFL
mmetsp:Transcript_2689/g.9641  ORF Transcript_2689/g.9641 Transcript_2689/m.9641 type:complete len:90 (-) Transcript_2689:1271-1540(-)